MTGLPAKQSLVVIGNGMAGMRTVEELLKLEPDHYDITVFGAEPHGNYNRILLSPVLAGDKKMEDIMLHTRQSLVPEIIKVVRKEHPYDVPCVLSTLITQANPDYRAWVVESTRGPDDE